MKKRTFLSIYISVSDIKKFKKIRNHLQDKKQSTTLIHLLAFPPEAKKKKDNKRILIDVTADQKKKIIETAKESGHKISEYISEIINNGFDKYFPPKK